MRTMRLQTATTRRATAILAAGLLALGTAACSSGTPRSDVTPTRLGAAPGGTSSAPTTPETSVAEETRPARSTTTSTVTKTTVPVPAPTATRDPKPAAQPKPKPKPEPAPVIILTAGDNGLKVRTLQARLKQINWFDGDVTNQYGPRTTDAVKGFQAKRGFAATGVLDETTWKRVLGMTRTPTQDELNNVKPKPKPKPKPTPTPTPTPKPKPTDPKAPTKPSGMSWDVDQRCLTGRVMCISKGTNRLTWVIDGVPQYQFDVRFGSEQLPTREGTFSVLWKKVDVISNIYHTPMPYSMFFSGGQAVHYSSNFARLGYNGSSHGCVNVRDWNGIVRLYNESRVGDKVVVHW